MRPHRLKVDGSATYHVMSKTHESRYFFGEREKSYMYNLMMRLADFTGCEIRTYAFMDNHFHVLLHVPKQVDISDDEVKRRAKKLYGKKKYAIMEQSWALWKKKGQEFKVKEQLNKFRVRMYNLSEFMKTFKQRLSIYYNHHHEHVSKGTLWLDRYKSVLVEENENSLLTVAAYIDLNSVRAGIVKDPKEYHWSGYAEAVAKRGTVRSGLCNLFLNSNLTEKEVLPEYHQHLYYDGARRHNKFTGQVSRPGFRRDLVDKVLDEGGTLSLYELLRCRVRYFSDGLIIGSKLFVEDVMANNSDNFSKLRRKRGANKMKYGEWDDLCAATELRRQVFS